METVLVDESGAVERTDSVSVTVLRQQLPQGEELAMVLVPEGSLLMGSPHRRGWADEQPQHYVQLHGFLLSQLTVTQRQWRAVMKRLPPCRGKGLDLPVDRVSWPDAQGFCAGLSRLTGLPYRLPSEAEWEYACRAGALTDFAWGNMITTDLANYVGLHSYRDGPTGVYRHGPVQGGLFPANRFGIYDMHGNLCEWCMDAWHEDYTGAPLDGQPWVRGGTSERVLRGGSWHDPPDLCRSASRLKLAPAEGEDFVGVRLALSLPEGALRELTAPPLGAVARVGPLELLPAERHPLEPRFAPLPPGDLGDQ